MLLRELSVIGSRLNFLAGESGAAPAPGSKTMRANVAANQSGEEIENVPACNCSRGWLQPLRVSAMWANERHGVALVMFFGLSGCTTEYDARQYSCQVANVVFHRENMARSRVSRQVRPKGCVVAEQSA